ncbi:hypothetical protein A165_15965 [Vibrio tasmaniensis ZS-17]|uniref:hypothetical protein n=1 Tax=Vibrio tasmaniensis TaxID=212663 RepID=UPI0002D9EF50|nr:hypothetical protein [Vibrio tasmaniensis]OED63028.1 hypothetical protein A165_15965 [Vibrio tasmaniensis ZS-17]
MNILLQNKEKLHGKIYRNDKCIGSGVPFMSQGRSFVLTCHHVLYGEGICKNSFDVKDISLAVGDSTVYVASTNLADPATISLAG